MGFNSSFKGLMHFLCVSVQAENRKNTAKCKIRKGTKGELCHVSDETDVVVAGG